jgi:autotransporter translocation and assembly factor TamB
LALQVNELVLQHAGWDLYGATGQIDSLQLRGGKWLRNTLRLGKLGLRSADLGEWQAAAAIEFSGQWPLTVEGGGQLPPILGWPGPLGRAVTVKSSGDLAALAVQVEIAGSLTVAARGSLNVLDPTLPFRLVVNGDWPGSLALSELVELPVSLATLAFTSPLQLTGSGSLDKQVFQLETTVGGLGYQSLDLRLAGGHEPGRFEVDDLRLADADGANTLWGTGELEYAQQVRWSAVLETSGLDLLPLATYGAGRIEGQLQLLGEVAGEEWEISLLEADLKGRLNDLPARLQGYAGLDSQLRLLPSELRGELNGTRLLLRASADKSQPSQLEIDLDDLGLWVADSHGSISLRAALAPGWEHVTATGSLLDLEWQGLKIGSGRIDGKYGPAEGEKFSLDVALADLAMAGIELDTARLSARGDASTQTASLQSLGDINGVLELAGKVGAGGAWAGQLAATTLQTGAGNWYLGEPVAVDFSPSPASLRLAAHCWQFGKSRVCPGETLLGEGGRTSLALDGDLAALSAFLPEYLELKGMLRGQFTASWAPGRAVTIDGEAEGRDILITRQYGGGGSGSVAWQRIDTSIHNDASGLALGTGFYSGDSRIIDLDLHVGADRGQPLSGTLDIAGLQLGTLAPFVPTMSVLAGELRGQLRLEGTIDRPLAQGGLHLSGGHFALLGNPTELQQFELQLDARGDTAAVQGEGLLGGGRLAVNGTLQSQPEWRLELALEGDRHEILLPPYTQMLVSEKLDVNVTGGLLDLKGDIVVHEGSLEHEQLPADGVTLSDDVVEVDLVGNVIYESAPFDFTMNIGLLIEEHFKIVGDMVNATVGGDLRLRQRPRQPLQVFGNLNVIGGELRAYQQRLRIQRGTVSFAGTPENPELDVRAQREISGDKVVVGLQLQGTLKQPKLEVFSDPVMSHGEAMSYLVRGRGLDSGAEADGVAMALSLGTGLVNQTALVTELNRIPGISNIAFGAEGSNETDTAATVGGYIGERLYLSYGMGIYEPINVLTARLYLYTRLWLEVVSRLENSVDLYYSFDIN